MAKVYFLVNTTISNPEKEVVIRMRFKKGTIDQGCTTEEKVKHKYWDFNKQELNRKHFKGKDHLKTRLSQLETHVLSKSNGALIKSGWLKTIVDEYLHPEKYISKGESMFDWIDDWIKKSKNGYRVVQSYKTVLNELKRLDTKLTWEDLDLDFYDKYITDLEKKGLAKNTIAARIKVLKVFCNKSFERGEHTNLRFKSFQKNTEESDNVYLNEDELDKIYKLDLSKTPYLDKVRDVFLVGCWTGCRFGDLHKVNFENIHEYKDKNVKGSLIILEQSKTKKTVQIPVFSVVENILQKYNGQLPEMISNQKFNDYIKLVAKQAKITQLIKKSITIGGHRKTKSLEKWEFISSHTARRSFATNLYKSGFPAISIMKITGHRTEASFLKYIKIEEEENAVSLMAHWNKLNNEKRIN